MENDIEKINFGRSNYLIRNIDVLIKYLSGDSYDHIARFFDITTERARQIVRDTITDLDQNFKVRAVAIRHFRRKQREQ